MKIKYTVLLFNLCFCLFSAQNTKFIYDFKYKTNSNKKDFTQNKTILDIQGNKVQYYEQRAIKCDSINQNSSINSQSMYSYPFPKISRELGGNIHLNYNLLGSTYWKFSSTDPIQWTLDQETKTKNQWTLQKATTHFGGRNWTAWFTQEIPISEGPYKFVGLPGLVVELYDDAHNFEFELVKVEKNNKAVPDLVERVFKKKPLLISFEKYQSLLLNSYQDPYAHYRSMKPGSWAIIHNDKEVNSVEGLNQMTKESQELFRKNYNPIEIDKAISL